MSELVGKILSQMISVNFPQGRNFAQAEANLRHSSANKHCHLYKSPQLAQISCANAQGGVSRWQSPSSIFHLRLRHSRAVSSAVLQPLLRQRGKRRRAGWGPRVWLSVAPGATRRSRGRLARQRREQVGNRVACGLVALLSAMSIAACSAAVIVEVVLSCGWGDSGSSGAERRQGGSPLPL